MKHLVLLSSLSIIVFSAFSQTTPPRREVEPIFDSLPYLPPVRSERSSIQAKEDGSIPILNSRKGARVVAYLKFVGEDVKSPYWTNRRNPLICAPANYSSDLISGIHRKVAEDFIPFDINITTDSSEYSKANVFSRTRVIFTPTYDWYGTAGGTAYIRSAFWGEEVPCFVFTSFMYDNVKYAAEATSHEIGHTLGLHHQSIWDDSCRKKYEYNYGYGSTGISWAPIMGTSYYSLLTTWHRGTSTYGCNDIQDDFEILTRNVGLVPDDYLDDIASNIDVEETAFTRDGLISTSRDIDVFSFDLPKKSKVRIDIFPDLAATNLDVSLKLQRDGYTRLYEDPGLVAYIDTTLNAGMYRMTVSSAGHATSPYGIVGTYTIQASFVYILYFRNFVLKGTNRNGVHDLLWSYDTDEDMRSFIVQSSDDGKTFSDVLPLNERSGKWTTTSIMQDRWYRLKATTHNETYYSNTLQLKGREATAPIFANVASTSHIDVRAGRKDRYQIVNFNGQVVSTGNLSTGFNRIDISNIPAGIYTFITSDASQKILKL